MPDDDTTRSISNFVALAVEWAFYGASIPLFAIAIRELLVPLCGRRKRIDSMPPPKINKKALFLAVMLFILSTLVLLCDIIQDIGGLVRHLQDPTHETPITPGSYFVRIKQGPERERGYGYFLITLLADACVAFRGFVVWRSKPVVAAIPWVLWAGLLTTMIGFIASTAMIRDESPEELKRILRWTTSFFVMSLIANVISTGLLAYKIWQIDREASGFRVGVKRSPLMVLLRVVIDSGLIYTVSLSVTIWAYVSRSVWRDLFINTMPSIICISFYLILIRIARSSRPKKHGDVESAFNSSDRALEGFSLHDCTTDPQKTRETAFTERNTALQETVTGLPYLAESGAQS